MMCMGNWWHSYSLPPHWLPGGITPYDGVPLEEVVSVHLSLTVIFSILATAGIAFAVACLIFNWIFRNRKYVAIILITGGCICNRQLKSLSTSWYVGITVSNGLHSVLPQADSSQQLQPQLLDRVWSSHHVHGYLFFHHPYHWPTSCGCTMHCKYIIDLSP